MPRYDYDELDHHPACAGGCGELADECRCARPNPLGSMRVTGDAGRFAGEDERDLGPDPCRCCDEPVCVRDLS